MQNAGRPRKLVWWNGRIRPYWKVKIGLLAHGLDYGTGFFEGIRGYWDEAWQELFLFRLEDHYRRFVQNWKILEFSLPYGVADLCRATVDVIRACSLRRNIYVKPLAFFTDEVIGVGAGKTVGLGIIPMPFGAYIAGAQDGIAIATTTWRRTKDVQLSPRAKATGLYITSALAIKEAQRQGAQEALFLNDAGFVSEGSGENIFIVKDGMLITPDVTQGILVGITRDTMIVLAEQCLGIKTLERAVERTEVWQADEVFLVGTACEIAPVLQCDGRMIGEGRVGPVTRALQGLYHKAVYGMLPEPFAFEEFTQRVASWVTPVYEKEKPGV